MLGIYYIMDPILDFFRKVDKIVKILQNNDVTTNSYDNLTQIDDKIINADLNLSFRDLAMRADHAVDYLMSSLTPNLREVLTVRGSAAQVSELSSVIRRLLSNYVNNPDNIKDREGRSLAGNYGIRVLTCDDRGFVTNDVQTFTGNNNNSCVQFINQFPISFLPAKIDDVDLSGLSENVRGLQKLQVIKCSSDVAPTSILNDVGSRLKNEYKVFGDDAKTVIAEDFKSIVKIQILDNHSTRAEIMQARMAKYGVSARLSDTISTFNYYLARNVGNFVLRLSIFELAAL